MPGAVSGLTNGKVIVNKETGQAKISQVVEGVDINEYLEGIKEVKNIPVKFNRDKIETNTRVLASLDEFKTKLTTLQKSIAAFSNRLPNDITWQDPVKSVFKSKTVTATASNGLKADTYVSFLTSDRANPGSFSLKINQIASYDLRKGRINAADTNTPLSFSGSFTIGTTTASSLKTINIDSSMTLMQITDAINAVSQESKVTAEMVTVSVGSPSTYELKLRSTETGAPILLNNTSGTPLSSLGLGLAASSKIAGIKAVASADTALNIAGTLTVSLTGNTDVVVPVSSGDSLNTIIQNINSAQPGSPKATASLQLVKNGTPNTYQIKLESTDSSRIVTLSDSGGVIAGLGLGDPSTDYESLVAKINCDGTDFVRTTNTVSDVINNVTMTLNSSAPGTTINGSVSLDTGNIATAVTEFLKNYNDLNDFYKKQTKMKGDFSGPEEGADLYNNAYVKQMFDSLKSDLWGGSGASTSLTSLRSIGIDMVKDDGSLIIKDVQVLSQAIDSNFQAVQSLFANSVTVSNSNFQLMHAPKNLGNISGKTITATLATDGGGLTTATLNFEGNNYSAKIGNVGGRIRIIADDNSPLKGFQIDYNGTLTNNSSVQSTISITRGLMSKADLTINEALDPTTIEGQSPPYDVTGGLMREISSFKTKNNSLQDKITEMTRRIEKEMIIKEREFKTIYQSIAEYNNIVMMIDSFRKANSKD